VETTTLGRTGVTVSRLGFGGAPAGLTNYLDHYSPEDARQRTEVVDAIQRAVELGITYFDTAPAYGSGASEAIFGDALAGLGESVFLATKLTPGAEEARVSVEASLRRLKRERIDLLQIHGSSYSSAQAEAFLEPGGLVAQMEALRDEGLVRFLGFTTEDQNCAVTRFIDSGRFDVMQLCYNLLYQHPAEQTRPFGSIFDAEAQQMGVVTMRTVTSGLFQRWVQWVNPGNTFDYTPALLQFVLSNPLVHVALVGMRDVATVEADVRIAEDLEGRIDIAALHEKYV
jgi:uncharacterized protein